MSIDEQKRPLTECTDDLDEDFESLREIRRPRRETHKVFRYLGYAAVVLISVVLGFYIGLHSTDMNLRCAAHTSQNSPVLEDVKISYATKDFNGSFMQESIYRRPGSPEVDKAWEDLGVDYRAGVVSDVGGLANGLTHGHVRRAQKYGGGFLVNVEGMHHLHCLNLVRKSLYFNIDYYKALGQHAFINEDDILQLHITHCLDTIRQVLMCNVDTGVLGQVWVNRDHPKAFPDFNTKHMCKNYEAVRQWAEEHQAPPVEELPPDYLEYPAKEDVFQLTP